MTNPAGSATDVERLKTRLGSPWPRMGLRTAFIALAVVAVYAWGLRGTDVQPAALVNGLPSIVDFFSRLFPPAWKFIDVPVGIGSYSTVLVLPEAIPAIVETVQMAIVGTSIAVFVAFPFGLLAARNTAPHRLVYQTTRFGLNLVRAVPEIVLALMFVAAVGLGPFGGVLALAVAAVGSMAKLYAEAIEAIDPAQVQAVTATGASRVQVFCFAVVPQALPLVVSYSILLFEANVRTATILGIVGAGGVGFLLNRYMALFQYQYLMGAMLIIIVAVTAIDRGSDAIRRRLI